MSEEQLVRRIVVAGCLSLFACLFGASGVGADTPRCVSKHEFERVDKGMTITKVHRIFDTEGDGTALGAPNQIRYYKTCRALGQVEVIYSPWGRVISKGANWFG
jgi:hypothetical protein